MDSRMVMECWIVERGDSLVAWAARSRETVGPPCSLSGSQVKVGRASWLSIVGSARQGAAPREVLTSGERNQSGPHKYEMTWFDFQLSTDNQNSRRDFFFFRILVKPGIYIGFRGVRVYWHCPFLCVTEKKAVSAILIFLIKNSLLSR